uniref:Uncharacterized protein n=1 Tax=Tanacetum cinerariifolium TaxID=118510 RepID=A0A6L2KBA9_TANCI|nr:hypothetical protein [Tanacetum cinerariifolium]
MSLTHISILSDSDAESVGSSASHVILSDTETMIVAVPAIVPGEFDLEESPEEDLLGLKDFLLLLKSLLLVMVSTVDVKLLMEAIQKRYDWRYQADEEHPTNYALLALTSSRSSFSSDSENYIPPKPDQMFIDEQVKSESSVDVVSNVSSSAVKTIESKFKSVDVKNKGVYSIVKTKTVRKNIFSPPIIEDQNSDDESKDRLKLKKFIELSTKLSDRVLDLEKIKIAQAKEIADLKKRVKKLERKRRSRTSGMNLFKIGTSKRRSLGKEDTSKQGRNLKQRSIFEESDFDDQAIMDVDYELATRLRAEE